MHPISLENSELCYNMKYARTNILKLSYFHHTVKLWNDLPLNLRKSDSINTFKHDLKSILFHSNQFL